MKNKILSTQKKKAINTCKQKNIQIPLPNENVWKNPKKGNKFRFDFNYQKKQIKEEQMNVRRKSTLENTLEILHSWFFN